MTAFLIIFGPFLLLHLLSWTPLPDKVPVRRPMRVTSGYRHPTHPIEAKKAKPGEHASGLCVW